MKRVIRLTERDLTRLVKRIIMEQESLPDGVYYGDGSGNEYALFTDRECTVPTGFKVINAPLTFRGAVYASRTEVTNGVPNSEDWSEGGEIVPVNQ